MTGRRCGTESCGELVAVTGRYVHPSNPAADRDAGYCARCAEVLEAADVFVPARPVPEERR